MTKAMVSMGFDKEDVVDAVSGYSFKKVESEMIFNAVLDVLYDILNAGAGVPLWKNEDCNCTLKGEWTEPKLYTNEHLKTDKATYEMYKTSDNAEKQSWAEQAKMRANKTANTYNEYILKNSYVWEGNIPEDIDRGLQIIN